MKPLYTVTNLINKNCYVASCIDLHGKPYQFMRLAQGLSLAPRILMKIMGPFFAK